MDHEQVKNHAGIMANKAANSCQWARDAEASKIWLDAFIAALTERIVQKAVVDTAPSRPAPAAAAKAAPATPAPDLKKVAKKAAKPSND